VSPPSSGFPTVTPRMVVSDGAAAVEFLRAVFGAAGDVYADRPAEMLVGDSLIMVSTEPPLNTPYGDWRAMVRDPFGNVYQIAHRVIE
jgi:PhnB protein